MFAWGAPEWEAFGSVLLGIGALVAGAWAVFNDHRNRRAEAARWLQGGVPRDPYLSDRFGGVRHVLEYGFDNAAGPLLERRITDRHVKRAPGR